MNLDLRQTRSLCLAGTAAFPKPFPSARGISIEDGHLSYPTGAREAIFVVVQEEFALEHATTRVVIKENVTAIFFPGVWENDPDRGRVFRFAEPDGVHDFDKGEWFLDTEIDAEKISEKMKVDIKRRDSGARGIIFVPESRPVLSVRESTLTAGTIDVTRPGCYIRSGCYAPDLESEHGLRLQRRDLRFGCFAPE